MPGHVHVVQGLAQELASDIWLLPVGLPAVQGTAPQCPSKKFLRDDAPEWLKVAVLPHDEDFALVRSVEKQQVWLVRTGIYPGEKPTKAIDIVERWLPAALAEWKRGRSGAPHVAMHLVSSGEKNAKGDSGRLAGQLLKVVEDFVAANECDITLVVRDALQFEALQYLRRKRVGDSGDAHVAKHLAARARQGQLAVFAGAGLSLPAGLPSWATLLDQCAERFLHPEEAKREFAAADYTAKGELLVAAAGAKAVKDHIAERCSAAWVALGHMQLANLPTREFLTLNYDTLLEQAAQHTGPGPVDVLPWTNHGRRERPRWLFKLHGSVGAPDSIVIAQSDYARYEKTLAAMNGVLEALLFTHHVLFVGFSGEDRNVHGVLEAVASSLRHLALDEAKAGTFLNVGAPLTGKARELLEPCVDFVELGPPPEGARRLAALLDSVLLHCGPKGSVLLNGDFSEAFSASNRPLIEETNRYVAAMRCLAGKAQDLEQAFEGAVVPALGRAGWSSRPASSASPGLTKRKRP